MDYAVFVRVDIVNWIKSNGKPIKDNIHSELKLEEVRDM